MTAPIRGIAPPRPQAPAGERNVIPTPELPPVGMAPPVVRPNVPTRYPRPIVTPIVRRARSVPRG